MVSIVDQEDVEVLRHAVGDRRERRVGRGVDGDVRVAADAVLIDAVVGNFGRAGMDVAIEVVAIAAAEEPGVAVAIPVERAAQRARDRLAEAGVRDRGLDHGRRAAEREHEITSTGTRPTYAARRSSARSFREPIDDAHRELHARIREREHNAATVGPRNGRRRAVSQLRHAHAAIATATNASAASAGRAGALATADPRRYREQALDRAREQQRDRHRRDQRGERRGHHDHHDEPHLVAIADVGQRARVAHEQRDAEHRQAGEHERQAGDRAARIACAARGVLGRGEPREVPGTRAAPSATTRPRHEADQRTIAAWDSDVYSTKRRRAAMPGTNCAASGHDQMASIAPAAPAALAPANRPIASIWPMGRGPAHRRASRQCRLPPRRGRVPRRMTVLRVRWLLLGIAAAVLVGHALVYNFVTDDAYISFVFARNFADTASCVQPRPAGRGLYEFLVDGDPWPADHRRCPAGDLVHRARHRVRAWHAVARVPRVEPALAGRRCGRVSRRSCSRAVGFACWAAGGLETELFTCW